MTGTEILRLLARRFPSGQDAAALPDGARTVALRVGVVPVQVTVTAQGFLHFSAPIFINTGSREQVLGVALAHFNADHLFRGGYCLVVEAQTLSIRLEWTLGSDDLDARAIETQLVAFGRRIGAGARWYRDQLEAVRPRV